MKNITEKANINKFANSMINHLFMFVILSIGELMKEDSLSKQLAIRELQDKVLGLIAVNSYAFFDIVVLPQNSEDMDNPLLILTVKNFEFFEKNHEPRHFRIIIHNNWQDYTLYQESIDGNNLIKI